MPASKGYCLFDTNVLLSALIRRGIYTNSLSLLNYTTAHENGILIPQIKKTIKNKLEERNSLDLITQLDNLILERIPQARIKKNLARVNEFYNRIKYAIKDKTYELEALILNTPQQYRKVAREAYRKQIFAEIKKEPLASKFLEEKFIKHSPNREDKIVLASAIALKDKYGSPFYVASTDTHLSPLKIKSSKNDFVSKRIQTEFNIICNWPDEILNCFLNKTNSSLTK